MAIYIDIHTHWHTNLHKSKAIGEKDQQDALLFYNLFQLNYPRHVSNK